MTGASKVVVPIVFLILNVFIGQYEGAKESRRIEADNHRPLLYTVAQSVKLAKLSNMTHFDETLRNILVPRVVGTPGHDKVKNYITRSMEQLGWTVETDSFEDVAPKFGRLTFHNLIARLNPKAKRYLLLACHYDSKYFRQGSFLGASDSAVPCSMMINLAKTMQQELGTIKAKTDLSLMFVFFDGEEAFENWGPTDSIYGARHLAKRWQQTVTTGGRNYLDTIDVFVLLDLLGPANPNFLSFFPETEAWYRLMLASEHSIRSLTSGSTYFKPQSTVSAVEDDHLPFMQRDVPILHLIPIPFPKEWHTMSDNLQAVDRKTVENLNMILRVFTGQYLRLNV